MKDYELTLIVPHDTTEDALHAFLQDLSTWIQGKEGIVEKQDIKKNVALLSPIQKHTLAYVATFKFKAQEPMIEELQKKVKDEKLVIRAMVTKFHKQKAVRIPSFSPLKSSSTPVAKEAQKMTTEEIDKQLEEIFKEKDATTTI